MSIFEINIREIESVEKREKRRNNLEMKGKRKEEKRSISREGKTVE